MPQTWTWRLAGDVVARYKVNAQFNPADADKAFDVADAQFRKVAAVPLTLKPSVEKLADGVYVIHNVAGQNQNSMAIEFKDHVFVVEAPGTSDGADNVIKRIKKPFPASRFASLPSRIIMAITLVDCAASSPKAPRW